jgi:hypothetical protein
VATVDAVASAPADPLAAAVWVAATPVGVVEERGVGEVVDGDAVGVGDAGGRGVVARTVGEVAGRDVCAAAFVTVAALAPSGRPATGGTVSSDDAAEVPGATATPRVWAGVAAWATQRSRPATATRRRADRTNGLTVQLPRGWAGATESVPSRVS